MAGVIRSRRERSFRAFGWAGMLLGLTGLMSVGLERVSCGHEHLVGGHSFYHHHFFFAAHGHPHLAHHPHRMPAPHGAKAPHKPATITPAPALFQPAGPGLLLTPLRVSAPVVPARVQPGVVQSAIQPARPRGPPASMRKDTQNVEARTR